MKKFLKIFAIFLVVVLTLLIVLPFAFKGKIVSTLKEEINNNMNAKVDFSGFGLSLFRNFPDFTLRIDNLSVAGLGDFEGDTLAKISSLRLTLDLMSVFKGSPYEIKGISLNDASILLKVLEDGKANWDIAMPSDTPVEEAEVPSEDSGDFKLQLKHIGLKNASFIYDDATMEMLIKVIGLNANLSGDLTADVTNIATRNATIDAFSFGFDGINFLHNIKAKVTAEVEADLAAFKFTFKDNEFLLNDLPISFEGFIAMPESDIDMDIRFAASRSEFKSFLSLVPGIFMKDFADLKTSGTLKLDGYAKGVFSDVTIPGFGLNLVVENGMFQYPDLPAAVKNVNINTKINNPGGDVDFTVVDVSRFHIEMANNPFDFTLLLKSPISDPDIKAGMKGKIDLSRVKEFFPLEDTQNLNGLIQTNLDIAGRLSALENERYQDFKADGSILVSNLLYKDADFPDGVEVKTMDLRFSPSFAQLAAFDARMGRSDFKANGRIDNIIEFVFSDKTLKGTLNLNSTLIDLNEFMGGEASAEAAEKPAESQGSELSVIEIPKNIYFTLRSDIGKVLYDNLEITNLKGLLKVKDGKLHMENLGMSLLDGQMNMSGFYDSRDLKKPAIDFDLSIQEFDIQKSFKAFTTVQAMVPVAERAYGKYSARLSFRGLLDEKMSPVLNSLGGAGSLNTMGVVVDGSPSLVKMADALKMDKYKKLTLRNVNIKFKIEDGKLEFDPFDVMIDNTSARFSGTTWFDQTINYIITLGIPRGDFGGGASGVLNNMVSQAGAKNMDVKLGDKVNIDVLVSGSFKDPKVSLGLKGTMDDLASSLKEQAKEQVQKVVDDVKQEVKEVIEDVSQKAREELERRANDVVKEAQNQAARLRAEAKTAGDKLRTEAKQQAQKLENEASNPIQKAAAKKTGEQLVKEADKKANDLEKEADTKAKNLETEAQKRAERIRAGQE